MVFILFLVIIWSLLTPEQMNFYSHLWKHQHFNMTLHNEYSGITGKGTWWRAGELMEKSKVRLLNVGFTWFKPLIDIY